MKQEKLNQINNLTSDMHDDIASVNEEMVDGNINKVNKYIDALIQKLRDLKSNLKKDEI